MKYTKVKIWSEEYKDKEEFKDTVFLKLKDHIYHSAEAPNDIAVVCLDYKSNTIEGGYLLLVDLQFNCIILKPGLNKDLPFTRDIASAVLAYPEWQLPQQHVITLSGIEPIKSKDELH